MTVSGGDIITLVEDYEVTHHHRHPRNDVNDDDDERRRRRRPKDEEDDGLSSDDHQRFQGTSFLDVCDDDGDGSDMIGALPVWTPSGSWWKDLLHFCGPGWLVSIAYVDPGNYQADIQAGGTTRYSLLWTIWWTSILSIYVQVLCVRLGYRTQQTLAQIQAQELKHYEQLQATTGNDDVGEGSYITAADLVRKSWRRYFAWFVAEFSVILTDLPEVIGFGIACNLFFGWPYWIGVISSLLTTMVFLATMNFGMRVLEGTIFIFVGIMSIALFVEMGFVGVDVPALSRGWVYGFVDATSEDLFAIVGILGAVVMPHNLYLHTGTVQTRKVKQTTDVIDKAILYSSLEPVLPIVVSFFVNTAVVSIAAESVFGSANAASVGLTDFCQYFQGLRGGCILWGVALLSAGQSSAITTTFTGQFIMDGYLELRLPVKLRAVVTRLVAITPCVLVAAFLPSYLNQLVNIVNASLAFLLPFALSPLIKYNCSPVIMGEDRAAKGVEKVVMYGLGILAWAVNAISLSTPGGGFFGDYVNAQMPWGTVKVFWIIVQTILHLFYAWWNYFCLFGPVFPDQRGYSRGSTQGDGICSDNESTSPETSESELVELT